MQPIALKAIEQTIPWHEAPKGATHYAPETHHNLASWYKLAGDCWYGINTDNAYMIATIGEHKWWQYGKTLARPMADLVERPKEERPVATKEIKYPVVIGFQIQNNNCDKWNNRPSYEILTEKMAVKELVAARHSFDGSSWSMIAILEGDLHEPTCISE